MEDGVGNKRIEELIKKAIYSRPTKRKQNINQIISSKLFLAIRQIKLNRKIQIDQKEKVIKEDLEMKGNLNL